MSMQSMKIELTKISGTFIIKSAPFFDNRGTFSRVFCKNEMKSKGLCGHLAQVNFSSNHKRGTLRGLHMQKGKDAEDKVVICTRGSLYDVCVDMRKDSQTYLQWIGEILSEDNCTSLYIPKGCAHGYLTLDDNTQVLYLVSQFFSAESYVGYRFDDPAFDIKWPPVEPFIISDKDREWEHLNV